MALARVRFRVDTTPDTDSTSDLSAAISSSSATSISVDDGTDFEVNQNIIECGTVPIPLINSINRIYRDLKA